jgi:hypothetical protein
VRYRFKGIVRTTGRSVEGHAHGDTPEEALNALSEHGITTESLREEPEAPVGNVPATPLHSALESALDTASQQIAFDALADKYKGKSVWVLDRDKIRSRVAQVVDAALSDAMSDSKVGMKGMSGVREQVAEAISGLFKDNRNLTSQVSSTSNQLEGQVKRIESMVKRAESVLAQMTLAISKMGSMSFGGGGGGVGPRRFGSATAQGNEQNSVLMEIFKENLRLRGIEIDEAPVAGAEAQAETGVAADAEAAQAVQADTETEAQVEAQGEGENSAEADRQDRVERPEFPQPVAAEGSQEPEQTPMKQWTNNL